MSLPFPIGTWAEMMKTKIVVHQPSTGAASMFGTPAMSSAGSTYMAHVQEINGVSRKLTGTDAHCSSVAWLASTSTGNMGTASVFTMPDGSTPPVRTVTYVRDSDGTVHHTKAVFG